MNQLKVYIDGKLLEIDKGTKINFSLSMNKITEIDEDIKANRNRIRAPMSPKNRAIMGHSDQILATELFNQTQHTAIIKINDENLILGKPYLAGCETSHLSLGYYIIEVINSLPQWYEDACMEILKNTPIDFNHVLSGELVKQSWTWENPIRFLPVQRDRYESLQYETEIPPVRVMTFEDYHPFVNIKAIMEAIVGKSGYSIVSEFMETKFFGSLYMSGYYPAHNTDILKSKMNFLAGKYEDTSAVANEYGYVNTASSMPLNSLGNIVDSADPFELSGGKRIPGAFNNGGCFKIINSRAAFIPTQDISVAFEFRFVYTSNFEVLSATELRGFNKIKLIDGTTHYANLANKLKDRKNWETIAGNYTLIIFNFDSTKEYQLTLINQVEIISLVTLNSGKYEFYCDGTFTAFLEIKGESTNPEWGLYDSLQYKEATLNIMVDVTLRSKPVYRNANQTIYFDTTTFGGAVPGEPITLHKDTSVRPIFYSNPMEGETVLTKTIFAHSNRQIELFRALKHLFNLRFYSDTISKKLYIEPRDNFFTENSAIDWSDKIDVSQPVIIQELGEDYPKSLAILYNDDDGSVMRWNEKYKLKYAEWKTTIKNLFARNRHENSINPLFSPTIDVINSFAQAPSASMIKVGNRDRNGEHYDDGDLNFSPKIVSFLGLHPLKTNETWDFPSYSKVEYPLVAFNFKDEISSSVSLCFDDYKGEPGLHRFYDKFFDTINNGKKITVSLNLNSKELEQLLFTNENKRDIRALFKLKINCEDIYCRFYEIIEYASEEEKTTKCSFIYNT